MDVELPPLSIRLLGSIEVRSRGEALAFPASKKTRALLGFLVTSREAHSRERLCSMLWEGPDDPRAQLRWSLAKLRPLLDIDGTIRLIADREHVRFDGRGSAVDIWEIEASSIADASLDELRRLEERCRGELMEGLDLPDAYRFQQWLVAEREVKRNLRVGILRRLVLLLAGSPQEALVYARAWVQIEPFSDAPHAAVVRILGALGRRREAQDHYDAVAVLFAREMGSALSGELEAVRRALSATAKETRPSTPASRDVIPPLGSDATKPPANGGSFVGRDELIAALELWSRSREASPRFLLLVGEPGVGKTRLLAELISRFDGRGEVLSGRAYVAERMRPFGSFVDALRELPREAFLESERRELATLLPELGPASATGDERGQFQAIERLLASRLPSRGSLLLCLDDAHWMDESTAGLLHYLSRSAILPGVLVVLTAREGELSENFPAARLLRSTASEGRLTELLVPPMRENEIAQLVEAEAPGADVRRVFTESEGIPLIALEVARALARGEVALSRSYDDRLKDRFERLSAASRALLPWAAALGRTFSVDILANACGLASGVLLASLQELIEKGLLRAAGAGFDFTHDLVRRAAYRQLAEPSRPLLHREIARTLAALPDPDGLVSAEVARHAAIGGERELAGQAATAAGEACLRIFARGQAAEIADIGLQAVRTLELSQRLPLELRLLAVHVHAAQRSAPEIASEVTRLVDEASGFPALKARGLFLLALLHYDSGQLGGAESAVLQAAEASRLADENTRCFSLANAGRCLIHLERDVPRARVHLAEAHLLATTHGLRNLELPMGLGFDALFRGDHEEAVQHLEHGLAIATREQDHWRECIFLVRLTRLELERSNPRAALDRCGALRPVAEKMGEGSERAVVEALEALAGCFEPDESSWLRFERAVQDLRAADSKADLAFVQNLAAELESGLRGDLPPALDSARSRALEAGAAARAIGLESEQAISRAVLAEIDAALGDPEAAAGHLAGLEPALEIPDALSARAYESVVRALETVSLMRVGRARKKEMPWNGSSSRTPSMSR